MAYIEIDVATQGLRLCEREGGRVLWETRVATAKNGVGERYGSYQTPRGLHIVRAKIGAGAPHGAVFVGRRPTGEIYSPALRRLHPQRDWVLTRILWLSGLTVGENRLGEVDTMRRYIYIHGAPDEDPMGIPSSHGCIKMRNDEVMELFERVPPGTKVRVIA
ncbi:L,D-transpeptidase [Acidiferrobacter sp.]|jgi:lipoprotein-anchoring transpeptidase ErfK/SrfK|uniref:L,D-transpeptidase n=1 Tax=Acidiferrobacter sp. TaxID=1872107 RepID=UPI002631E515|nr:L,D-transpeptidase [Acidiferrobacter sp.]